MLTRSDVQPGVFIGNYKLLARISSVGMASVWLAELGKDDDAKLVLVKTLRPRSPEDGLRAKAFLAEATVASTLAHPNVMQVSDFGEAEGRYFLATEFSPGRTLRQIGRRARKSNQHIDLRFLLRVAIDVCSALSYLHAFDDGSGSRHVHLEVRPENIMVAFSGLVKLVDLGVRAVSASPDRAGSRYLAPERADSSEPSPTWDTYALGVVLYEHATGVLPFDARQASPSAARSGSGSPLPPSVHNAAIARPLSDIILRSIAVDPTERYQSAASLARALNGYLVQFEPEGLNFSLDSYVSELFPGEASAQVKAVARPSSVQGEPPISPVFWSKVESPKIELPPQSPPVVARTVSPPPLPQPGLAQRPSQKLLPKEKAEVAPSVAPAVVQSGQDAQADEVIDAIDAIETEWEEPSTEPSIALSDLERELSKPPLEATAPEEGRGEPALGGASGAFRAPADSLFASTPRSANIFATRAVGAPRELAASTSRDLFTTWRAPRPHQAFSMAQSGPRVNEHGASPPLGSVFSTRKDTAPAAAPGPMPMLSPEAQRAATAFDRGLELVKRKDHQRALEAWREAVALDPGNRTYQANLKRLERLIASISSART